MKTKFSRTVPTMAWHVQKTKMSEYVTQHFDTKRNWILTEEPLRKFPIASTADRIHLNVLLECSVSTPFFRSIRGSATSCTKSASTDWTGLQTWYTVNMHWTLLQTYTKHWLNSPTNLYRKTALTEYCANPYWLLASTKHCKRTRHFAGLYKKRHQLKLLNQYHRYGMNWFFFFFFWGGHPFIEVWEHF